MYKPSEDSTCIRLCDFIIRCRECKFFSSVVIYKDGKQAIVCNRGFSTDPNGWCWLAEEKPNSCAPGVEHR